MGKGQAINVEWLRERFPNMTNINFLLDDYEKEFGWRPVPVSVYMRAKKAGITKTPSRISDTKARRLVWTREPEMTAWMLEHDHGQRMDQLSDEFCERFGFKLSRGQISVFRAKHGKQTKDGTGGGRRPLPVGTERYSKDGYIVIKVAERPSEPMSKDNWKLKQVYVWERTHGPVPDGCRIYFANGDKYDFSPDNLVAVPRKLIGMINQLKHEGIVWHDAESLQAVVTMAEIRIERTKIRASEQKVCRCCGKTFTDIERYENGLPVGASVCPECGKAYRRPRKYDHDEIRRLSAQGLSTREVAARVGCCHEVVSRVMREEK